MRYSFANTNHCSKKVHFSITFENGLPAFRVGDRPREWPVLQGVLGFTEFCLPLTVLSQFEQSFAMALPIICARHLSCVRGNKRLSRDRAPHPPFASVGFGVQRSDMWHTP